MSLRNSIHKTQDLEKFIKLTNNNLTYCISVCTESCRDDGDCSVTQCSSSASGGTIHCIHHQCTCTVAAGGSGMYIIIPPGIDTTIIEILLVEQIT
jgi:hypothetical protein